MLSGRVSKAADVYSFGITMWELYTGNRAFEGIPRALLGHQITREKLRPRFPEETPLAFKELAEKCWAASWEDRYVHYYWQHACMLVLGLTDIAGFWVHCCVMHHCWMVIFRLLNTQSKIDNAHYSSDSLPNARFLRCVYRPAFAEVLAELLRLRFGDPQPTPALELVSSACRAAGASTKSSTGKIDTQSPQLSAVPGEGIQAAFLEDTADDCGGIVMRTMDWSEAASGASPIFNATSVSRDRRSVVMPLIAEKDGEEN